MYKIPVLMFLAIEFGLDSKSLAAAALHIAHWASISNKNRKRKIKTKMYFKFFTIQN
jgi:hypothetical protein